MTVEKPPFPVRFLCWFCVFLPLQLLARLSFAAVVTGGFYQGVLPWMRAIASDLAMSVFLALFAAYLGRHGRIWSWGFFLFWMLVLAGNREYIGDWQANMSVVDIPVLLHGEFIRGSVFIFPLFAAFFMFVALGIVIYCLVAAYARAFPGWKEIVIYTVAASLIFAAPVNPPQLWAQQNLLEANLMQIYRLMHIKPMDIPPRAVQEASRFAFAMRRQDLSGTPIVTPAAHTNVLIVNIESLSQETLRRGFMPYLSTLAAENLHYTQYINPSITTIRGMFSQLCGEESWWDRFGRDRIAGHIAAMGQPCLPRVLNDLGYATVYMQAAALGFQDKENVMSNMEFGEVIGDTPETEGNRFSEWGVDDPSLFANAAKKIEQLEKQDPTRPWMLTLLTIGTHHPYNVDPSFDTRYHWRERAYRYTDQAIKGLVDWLESTGRRDRTLLIITGDESRETRRIGQRIANIITRNQGIMVILSPGREKETVKAPFMQSDLPISIIDYLDTEPPLSLSGRSLFREYNTFRPVAFSDYSQGFLYALQSPGELLACHTEKWDCKRYGMNPDLTIFDPAQPFTAQPAESSFMRALLDENTRHWWRTKSQENQP